MATGPKIPITCTTIELKDLSDLTDFEKEGEVDAVYAFQLTQDGYYKRKEIDDDKKPRFPKFEQLRNVETDGYQDDIQYHLVHKGNKWILQEEPKDIDWLIKFEFKSPVTLIGKDNKLKKALNAAPLLTSLIPEGDIGVKPFKRNQYLIHRLTSATATPILKFQPEITIGDQATIILDIIIKPQNNSIKKFSLINTLTDGISITLPQSPVEEVRTVIVIDKNGNTVRKMSTDKTIDIHSATFTSLTSINLTHAELIAFYYIDRMLPEEVLEKLIDKLNL